MSVWNRSVTGNRQALAYVLTGLHNWVLSAMEQGRRDQRVPAIPLFHHYVSCIAQGICRVKIRDHHGGMLLGPLWGRCWGHRGAAVGVTVGSLLGPLLEPPLGHCWGHCGVTVGSLLGPPWGHCWVTVGATVGSLLGPPLGHCWVQFAERCTGY